MGNQGYLYVRAAPQTQILMPVQWAQTKLSPTSPPAVTLKTGSPTCPGALTGKSRVPLRMGSGAHCELSLQVGLISSVGAPGEEHELLAHVLPAHVLPACPPCAHWQPWSGLMFTCPTPSISQIYKHAKAQEPGWGSSCGGLLQVSGDSRHCGHQLRTQESLVKPGTAWLQTG